LRKRYVVLGLSLLLALAIAVPAYSGAAEPTATTSASAKKIAKKALKKAKRAKRLAQQALDAANAAQTDIDALVVRVTELEQAPPSQGPAGPAGPQGPAGPAGPAGGQGPSPFTQDLVASIDDYGDPDVTLTTNHGFRWFLRCNAATNSSELVVENVSGGDDSGIEDGTENNDFDQDTEEVVADATTDDTLEESDQVLIYGSAGNTTQTGFGGVFDNPSSGFGGDDCVGSLNFLAL
jgi:hypothetical protein